MEQIETRVEKLKERGKKYSQSVKKVDLLKKYTFAEAVKYVKETAYAKFDETVDLAIRLGVDPKHPEQIVKGSVSLPYGLGKKVTVVVIAKGDKEKEAKEAGADYVGGEDIIQKIQGGWTEFDKLIVTPDMMGMVSKLGKILGPKGLMPSPKMGTVTFDISKTVSESKKGKVDFKIDKAGNIHVSVGKKSFSDEALLANLAAIMEAIIAAKPPTSKGVYLRSVTLSTTMGPGIKIDPLSVKELLKK